MANEFIKTQATNEQRLDAAVAGEIEGLSRSAAQRLIEMGMVTVNSLCVPKNYKLQTGDRVVVTQPELKPVETAAQNIPLDIVYEDEYLLVVNKPKGMVVHPAAGHGDGTLVNALLHHCGDSLSGINGEIRPGIVHRIDKDTSGLLLVAKNDKAHISLSEQIKEHSFHRSYEAVVVGKIKENGRVEASIGRHPVDRKKMAVTQKNAKQAATNYEVIENYNGYTHVKLILETGRTHQIRVHMASIGHPVVGDTVYGLKKAVKGLQGQCLHAKSVGFVHPATGQWLTFDSPLPECFCEILDKLKQGKPL